MSEPDPARIVADADVLAADVLVGDPARAAMDVIRSNSWLTLVATELLLEEAETIIAELADADLALAWRTKIESITHVVDQPPGDHPALAAAYHGDAAQILSFDVALASVGTGAKLRAHVATSVRSPDAFLTVFDSERLYPAVEDGPYPGPDRDPRF